MGSRPEIIVMFRKLCGFAAFREYFAREAPHYSEVYMENIVSIVVPVLLLLVLIRIIAMPIRLLFKIGINSLCGLLCLWLLNWIAGFTGIWFPINLITVAVAGFLGLPGIALLALVQVIL